MNMKSVSGSQLSATKRNSTERRTQLSRYCCTKPSIARHMLSVPCPAASALVGFWQMMTAAIGVWLAATISHDALFALGVVLTVFSLVAVGLYTLRAKPI
jgi:hypothetical protein